MSCSRLQEWTAQRFPHQRHHLAYNQHKSRGRCLTASQRSGFRFLAGLCPEKQVSGGTVLLSHQNEKYFRRLRNMASGQAVVERRRFSDFLVAHRKASSIYPLNTSRGMVCVDRGRPSAMRESKVRFPVLIHPTHVRSFALGSRLSPIQNIFSPVHSTVLQVFSVDWIHTDESEV